MEPSAWPSSGPRTPPGYRYSTYTVGRVDGRSVTATGGWSPDPRCSKATTSFSWTSEVGEPRPRLWTAPRWTTPPRPQSTPYRPAATGWTRRGWIGGQSPSDPPPLTWFTFAGPWASMPGTYMGSRPAPGSPSNCSALTDPPLPLRFSTPRRPPRSTSTMTYRKGSYTPSPRWRTFAGPTPPVLGGWSAPCGRCWTTWPIVQWPSPSGPVRPPLTTTPGSSDWWLTPWPPQPD